MNGQRISVGESYQQDTSEVMKTQIRETIQTHMKRRDELRQQGIKPLCLFFIDKVASFI
jgi:restriction endonuclease